MRSECHFWYNLHTSKDKAKQRKKKMIRSINFLKKKKTDGMGYELTLPNLRGKKFDFKPGVNLIIGENGSGKTSLLNVMRRLTMCEGCMGSAEFTSKSCWRLALKRYIEKGYFDNVEMSFQGGYCTFNVKKINEIEKNGGAETAMDFVRAYYGGSRSAGENQIDAISWVLQYIKDGCLRKGETVEMTSRGVPTWMDFRDACIEKIAKDANQYEEDGFKKVLKWYEDNSFSCKKSPELIEYNGVTVLSDEPDVGVDINKLDELFRLYKATPPFYQHIVAMHNPALIHRLNKIGANIIELTDGYLEQIEDFVEGRD